VSDAWVRAFGDDDALRLVVSGEIDLANADQIENQLLSRIPNLVSSVVVDLAEVTFIDSSGVRMLFSLVQRLDATRTALIVIAPHGSVARRVLDLCGMDKVAIVQPAAVNNN
jgi:anti-anti-sigma factor